MDAPAGDSSVERARPKLARLLKLAKGRATLLAQTHDYPDPDTMASAMALAWLMRELAGLECTIGYGGIVGRAENRAMMKVLGIKLRKTARAEFAKYDLVALLDTQPECSNHSLPSGHTPDIVVDHHFAREPEGPEPALMDIGGDAGTTSTKVAELFMAADLKPTPEVATALFYGVKSDTMNLARVTSPADVAAYLWLFPFVDNALISEIEHPQVPLDYFRVFNKAIERGKIYGNMIVADLGEVYTPDLCAELADRLLQVEGIRHALATGWFEDSLFLSLRSLARGKNCGKILNSIVAKRGIGSAGGHGPMAGARVPVEGRTQRSRTDLRRKLVQAIIRSYGQDPRRFQRIMTKSANGRTGKGSRRDGGSSRTTTSIKSPLATQKPGDGAKAANAKTGSTKAPAKNGNDGTKATSAKATSTKSPSTKVPNAKSAPPKAPPQNANDGAKAASAKAPMKAGGNNTKSTAKTDGRATPDGKPDSTTTRTRSG